MKSNPYVYPYVPFVDLSDKKCTAFFETEKTVDAGSIRDLLARHFPLALKLEGDTVEERILSVFLDDEVRFGEKGLIADLRTHWIEAIRFFTRSNRQLEFTLLGFPFKAPVPLKTSRVLPDLGELLVIARLKKLICILRDTYAPGARITVFTEGGFAPLVGVGREEADEYAKRLNELNEAFGDESIVLRSLSEMEGTVLDFHALWEAKTQHLKELYKIHDRAMVNAYEGAYDSIFRIVSTRREDMMILLDVYNENLADNEVSAEAGRVRKKLHDEADEAVFRYHAYLQVRDDIGFLARAVPHALALSVSPKPYRLGIQPIGKGCIRLPYHAVPVLNVRTDAVTLEYLIDLKRGNGVVTPVRLENDPEQAPFYYELRETSMSEAV